MPEEEANESMGAPIRDDVPGFWQDLGVSAAAKGTPLPDSVAARWPAYEQDLHDGPGPYVELPWPMLTESLFLGAGHPWASALAFPYGTAAEVAPTILRAAAEFGMKPLCVNPSWTHDIPGVRITRLPFDSTPEDLESLQNAGDDADLLLIDQFSRLYRHGVDWHEREALVEKAALQLHHLTRCRHRKGKYRAVIVIVRWKARDGIPAAGHLGTDVALDTHTTRLLMIHPHANGRAAVRVVKDRNGPTGATLAVRWPVEEGGSGD